MRIQPKENFLIDILLDDHGLFDRHEPVPTKVRELFKLSVGRCAIKWLRKHEFGADVNHLDRYYVKFPSSRGLSESDTRYATNGHLVFLNQFDDDIRTITDFLRVSVQRFADWIDDVDDYGRPKRLMKCGTIEQLVREHDIYFEIRERPTCRMRHMCLPYPRATLVSEQLKKAVTPITSVDEQEYADLGLGYKLVQMLTPNALRHESVHMHHCIGWGSYDHLFEPDDFRDYEHKLLSLRSPDGKRLATAYIEDSQFGWCVQQFKAQRNAKPEQYLYDLVAPLGWLTRADYAAALDAKNRAAQKRIDEDDDDDPYRLKEGGM